MHDLRHIIAWSKKRATARSAISRFGPGPPSGTKSKATAATASGRKCPTYNDCFYFRARRRVYNAQLLIVNHALFFSDLAVRRNGASILPDYDAVIFDEAHTLEAVAGDHLGLSVTSGQVQFCSTSSTTTAPTKACLSLASSREAQDLIVECHARADELFDDALRSPAGPAIAPAASAARQHRKSPQPRPDQAGPRTTASSRRDRQRIRAARLHLGPRSATALAGELTHWIEQQSEGSVYWIEAHQPRPAARRTLRRSDRCRPRAPRASSSTKRRTVDHDQRHLAIGKPPRFDFFKSRVGLTHARPAPAVRSISASKPN